MGQVPVCGLQVKLNSSRRSEKDSSPREGARSEPHCFTNLPSMRPSGKNWAIKASISHSTCWILSGQLSCKNSTFSTSPFQTTPSSHSVQVTYLFIGVNNGHGDQSRSTTTKPLFTTPIETQFLQIINSLMFYTRGLQTAPDAPRFRI